MKDEIIKKSFGTHDGSFHADEITACAFLILFDLVERDKIFRSRDENVLKRCEYVCDVGGRYDPKNKRFDHHQKDYTGDLSSAGMILKYLKDKKIISSSLYSYFNNSIVLGVDYHDIGKVKFEEGICTFSQIIANFSPIGYHISEKDFNNAFFQALDFTYGHLKRVKDRFYYLESTRNIVKKSMKKKKRYLIFDKSIPWLESFFEEGGKEHPALFVVMPTGEHWKLRAIPPSYEDRMNVRMPLPEEWAGIRGDKLKEITGISGAIFCHKNRFISIWESKQDAIKALEYILKEEVK
ncbi:MAG: hypothetical protein AMS24_03750 [Chlamydiae bacterium SM23_39]|nr:MAG: hypothetical protein AMS24_03750 [Chlamydiae bacterium SM23_39]